MVYMRLWPPNPSARRPWPHGTVHRACWRIRLRHSSPGEWRSAGDEHAADLDFPDHTLF